jgi:hypothetical protein
MPQDRQSGQSEPQSEQNDQNEKEYVLDSKSESDEVVVDKKTLTKGGKPVALSQEEYDRVKRLNGVKLTEANKETEE